MTCQPNVLTFVRVGESHGSGRPILERHVQVQSVTAIQMGRKKPAFMQVTSSRRSCLPFHLVRRPHFPAHRPGAAECVPGPKIEMSMSQDDFIAQMVREGASEATLREVFSLADTIHSVADLKVQLGEPDRTDTWTDELDEKARLFSEKCGLAHERWLKCHIYYERWRPVYLTVFEFEDGSVSWSVAVCPSQPKDSPPVPPKGE